MPRLSRVLAEPWVAMVTRKPLPHPTSCPWKRRVPQPNTRDRWEWLDLGGRHRDTVPLLRRVTGQGHLPRGCGHARAPVHLAPSSGPDPCRRASIAATRPPGPRTPRPAGAGGRLRGCVCRRRAPRPAARLLRAAPGEVALGVQTGETAEGPDGEHVPVARVADGAGLVEDPRDVLLQGHRHSPRIHRGAGAPQTKTGAGAGRKSAWEHAA